MQRPSKFTGPITPEELEEVFGWALMHPDAVLIERQVVNAFSGGGIIVPEKIRRDRQTGAPQGYIIQMGAEAKEKLDERLASIGRPPIKPGDRVTFSIMAPKAAGLVDDNGHPILPGFSESAYAGVEFIHWSDVMGYVPKEKLKKQLD